MADTFTPNYDLVKPEVGSSRDAWGGKWNGNADSLDAALKAQKDDYTAKTAANAAAIAAIKGMPSGAMAYFAMVTPPTGWLKANGASLLRTDYPDLFAAIGTTFGAVDATHFNLPDVRGYFFRPFDDGRGIDSGRTIFTTQQSQNLAHAHVPLNNYRFTTTGPGENVQAAQGVGTYGSAAQTSSSGGAEARPVNIAFPVFIKT